MTNVFKTLLRETTSICFFMKSYERDKLSNGIFPVRLSITRFEKLLTRSIYYFKLPLFLHRFSTCIYCCLQQEQSSNAFRKFLPTSKVFHFHWKTFLFRLVGNLRVL